MTSPPPEARGGLRRDAQGVARGAPHAGGVGGEPRGEGPTGVLGAVEPRNLLLERRLQQPLSQLARQPRARAAEAGLPDGRGDEAAEADAEEDEGPLGDVGGGLVGRGVEDGDHRGEREGEAGHLKRGLEERDRERGERGRESERT